MKPMIIYGVMPVDKWPGYAQFHCTKDGMPCEPRKADITVEITGGRITVSGEWPTMEVGRYTGKYVPNPLHAAITQFAEGPDVPPYLKDAIGTTLPPSQRDIGYYLASLEQSNKRTPR
ncbi:MAG TPA: hypothetical protein VI979_04335 [archaeon]|nr:hypothetical protein [archaeon]